ncbi:hypothetical protein [Novosphingobium sp. TCA1]|jgi:hypothetical protein|uniref:hypothetical protein n=1 Tax=Novosphingobium sp. TCA1 TaxID=2682474 RepID=UPI00130A8194|nr:hypothetical protein [Novosphingobium sp. TCA1]GFE72373.1 hypothetical protein NTCA1_00220 [Novosphingobium sp. TCA1]
MATENIKLGSKCRVYIGKTQTADPEAADAITNGFELIENENEFTLSYSVDAQEIDTKSAGKISMPGTESWELTFTTNAALTDAADTLLRQARNKSWSYLIVEDGTKKLFSGNFLMTGVEITAGATGVREGSYTLSNSGEVTQYDETAPVTP